MSGRRIGLFGGSFDPIHLGHVVPVRDARRALRLDRVLYLPTADPPHKSHRRFAPELARYAMVELALLHEEGLYVSPFEMTTGRPAYTVETLEAFRAEEPQTEFFLLIGSDSFLELSSWRRWRELPGLARPVVLARPGFDPAASAGALEPELSALLASGGVDLVADHPTAISSTEIRRRLAAGEELPAEWLPPLVLDYLRKYDLYR